MVYIQPIFSNICSQLTINKKQNDKSEILSHKSTTEKSIKFMKYS